MPRVPLIVFYLFPWPVFLFSLVIGPTGSISVTDSIQGVIALFDFITTSNHTSPSTMTGEILLNVRLPRICLAFLVGGALSVSGTSLQAMVRNPLVSPDILGLSSGAAFGAALALSCSWLPVQPTAFVFGLVAVILAYIFALNKQRLSLIALVLSGIIIGSVFTALLTLIQVFTDPFKLQSIVHWTMGNLHTASWAKVQSAFGPIAIGVSVLYFFRWRLNVLALGDVESHAVGANPEREKLLALIPASLIASAAVAVAGIISMVGLTVPHIVRMLVGADNLKTVPVSFLFGGSFLVLIDDLSRSITSFELPVGVFTTVIGGPFFVYLLKQSDSGFRE